MFNVIAADAWSSEAVWLWYSARRAVSDAIEYLEDAGTALAPLVADTEWHAKGVMALHERIIDLKARAASEIVELESRLGEIERLGAS